MIMTRYYNQDWVERDHIHTSATKMIQESSPRPFRRQPHHHQEISMNSCPL